MMFLAVLTPPYIYHGWYTRKMQSGITLMNGKELEKINETRMSDN